MKTFLKPLLLITFLFLVNLKPYAQTITRTIGTGGDYTTMNAAFTAVFMGNLTGGDLVFEIISDITETNQSVIHGSGSASASYSSITIYPTGAARTITADLAGPMLYFFGSGSNITFDGRIDQTGSDNQLTFHNTNASGNVFHLSSSVGIDNVNIQYCNILSDGNEIISLTADNADVTNTLIDNCNIGSESSTITKAIWSNSSGTGTITATLSNCNVYNFWDAANASYGLFLDTGSESWTISNNSFYQTATRTSTVANTHYGIYINDGDGHSITNNYLGGSEALCGGTAWTTNGDYANTFIGIYLNVGSTTPASIDGNVISNFNHTYHSTTGATEEPGIWTGIYLTGGDANIGTSTGNTIGSVSGTDDIVVNSTAAANVTTYGLAVNATGATVDISNNQIGGFTLNATSTTNGHSFTGIQNSASSDITIDNNTIGSSSVPDNIQCTNPNASGTNAQNIKGIVNDANTSFTVSNNIIANLTNSCVQQGELIGIYCSDGINAISDNSISQLSSSSDKSLSRSNIAGISVSSSLAGQEITNNEIFELSNSSSAVSFTNIISSGIEISSGTGTIEKNTIYHIDFARQYGIGYGIYLPGGTYNVMNNSIRLGLGYALSNPLAGILSWGGNRILGNTVFITGSPTVGDDLFLTYAYCIPGSGSDEVKNNNFVNQRIFQTYAHHYAIGKSSSSTLVSNYNNLFTSDDAYLVNYNTSESHIYNLSPYSLTDWQTNSGNDANSLSTDPQFAGAEDAVPDLHISASSPVINMGTSVYPLVTDIDDDIRDQQPDIGCDESYTGSVIVGLGETYETLKAAFDAINAGTITGNISINLTTNTTEPATATLYQSGYNGTSDYTSISIGTVSENISVSGNIADPIISFNGAHDVNMVDITVENQNANGYCIQFINSASNNRIAGCTLSGDVQLSDKGLVTFDIAGTGSGNDNNSIENCIFSNNIANYRYGVLSMGTAAIGNNDNSITESIISNFWSNGNSSAGIYLDENNSNWEFIGNHLYQTDIIASTGGADHFGIYTISSNNISIQDNFIGGSAAECGGIAWTVNGSQANTFSGIYISGENIDASEINGNTIRNFNWTSAPVANMYEGKGVWTGITYGGGIITISDNTIGAITGNNNIVVETTSAFHVASYGIAGGSAGSGVDISDNTIGSIDVSTNSVDYSHIFAGIQNDSAITVTISGNLIGSESTANSINASTACTHTVTGQHVAGIINNANTTACTIDNNVIKNLYNSTVSSWSSDSGSPFGHSILGIAATDGVNTITSNTIDILSTTSIDARTEVIRGISLLSDKEGQEISNNVISELYSINNLDNSKLIGIWYDGPITGTNLISNNRIYYILSAEYSGLASEIFGIYIYSDGIATRIENNMISLGTTETAGHYITGIYTTKNGTFYHNSVVIDGSVSGSLDANTFAFRISLATSSAVVKNNIFVNTRTNSGTGKNYAVSCPGTNVLDYNDYWVAGTGTMLGNDGTVDKTELPIVLGQDQNSINQEVIFTHALGMSVADLHTGSAAVNGVADPSVGVNTDFDGDARNPLYPDMGADEFTLPVIIDPGANLDFGWTDVLTPTASQSYEILGIDLTGDITVTAPLNFQVSLESDANFAQSVSIPPVNSNVNTTVYARFLPNEEGLVFGDITNASSGVEQTVHVQGSARVIHPVMATGAATDITTASATLNAEILNTGGRSVTNRGIIYWAYDGVDKEIGNPAVTNENEAGTFEEGTYSMAVVGLNINSQYNYRAHANNGDYDFGGTGYGETADFWTHANIPDAPTLTDVTSDTINISINENLNPVSTEFAIHETTTNRYIQADGSMGTNPVWQTKADWGTTIVTLYNAANRTGNRTYSFKSIARNGAEVETDYSVASNSLSLASIPNPTWVGNPTLSSLDVATYTYATDYSGNSTGTLYAIKEVNTVQFVQSDGTLAADTVWKTRDDWVTVTVTGLSHGTQYAFSSIATNDDGIRTEPGPATSLSTFAATPGQPIFTNITATTADITIDAATNPGVTEYIISLNGSNYVQADGTIGNNAVWQTKAIWDNTTISGLSPNTTNTFAVKARNGDQIETANGVEESIITLATAPLPPLVYTNNSYTDQFQFFIDSDANAASTEYATQDSISGLYVQIDGSLGASPVWQTRSTWQSSTNFIIGLSTGTNYVIRAKARNADLIETSWGIGTAKSTMPNIPGAPVINNITDNAVSVEISANGNPANITYAIYAENEMKYIQADGSFGETEIWQTETDWGTTTISNLGANQIISLQVKAKNDDDAETTFSQKTENYTMAKIPAEPDVEVLSATSVGIVVNTNDNPASVFYAIQEVTTGKYVSYYYGLDDVEDWRTIEFWENTTVGGLEQLTAYTFRVKARNSDYVETSYSQDTSVTTTLALPPAPTLVSPSNNAMDAQIPATLSWQAVEYAISYDIEYSKSYSFNAEETHSVTGITDLSLEINDLDHSYTYYWRVRATNETGTGPWSDDWVFTTIAGPPIAPVLVSPVTEATDLLPLANLDWNDVNHATGYSIQLSTDVGFTEVITDSSGIQYSSFTTDTLDGNTTYYWRTKASNSYGSSDWSDAWSFSTIATKPDIPVLLAPANDSTEAPTSVGLDWEVANLADFYHVQVATENTFDNLIAYEPEWSNDVYNLYDLAENTTFYWRVKSVNNWEESDWSEVWSFTTINGTGVITNRLIDVSIYPNPVGNILYINGINDPTLKISVFSESGVKIIDTELTKNTVSTDQLKPGNYILRIETNGGTAIKKFIKQ